MAPFFFVPGASAVAASAILSGVVLFAVGALLSLFTAHGPLVSGLRMLLVGLLAAGATFGIGRLLGVSVAA